jgi:hypothetical protein
MIYRSKTSDFQASAVLSLALPEIKVLIPGTWMKIQDGIGWVQDAAVQAKHGQNDDPGP